jgi:hypothetical protein
MKKHTILLLFIISITLMSCDNGKIQDLQSKIIELKTENTELKNAITKDQINKFTSSYFTVTNKNKYLTVGKKEKLKISLITIDTIPEFNIYSYEENGRKLIMGKLNSTELDYNFIPSSVEDNKIDFTAEIELERQVITLPIYAKFDIRKE